jgi:hypothetical protein
VIDGVADIVQPVLLRLHPKAFHHDIPAGAVVEADPECVAGLSDESRIDERLVALRDRRRVQFPIPGVHECIDAGLLFRPAQFRLGA